MIVKSVSTSSELSCASVRSQTSRDENNYCFDLGRINVLNCTKERFTAMLMSVQREAGKCKISGSRLVKCELRVE